MKKIAKLMTLALAVITLASCEDVPSPFGTVTPPKTQGESSTVEPAGSSPLITSSALATVSGASFVPYSPGGVLLPSSVRLPLMVTI